MFWNKSRVVLELEIYVKIFKILYKQSNIACCKLQLEKLTRSVLDLHPSHVYLSSEKKMNNLTRQ